MNTRQFAERLGLEQQSVRKRLCQTGSYYGIVPVTLPNGRLDWPDDAHDQLLSKARPAGNNQHISAA